MLPVQSGFFMETAPTQRRFRGRVWWTAGGAWVDGAGAGGKVQAPRADGAGRGKADKGRGRGRGKEEGRWRERPATGKMTSLLAATLDHSGGVAAGHMNSGGLGVALPCASAKRSRLLPGVSEDRSYVGRKPSPRDEAIIRSMNESVFAKKRRD